MVELEVKGTDIKILFIETHNPILRASTGLCVQHPALRVSSLNFREAQAIPMSGRPKSRPNQRTSERCFKVRGPSNLSSLSEGVARPRPSDTSVVGVPTDDDP